MVSDIPFVLECPLGHTMTFFFNENPKMVGWEITWIWTVVFVEISDYIPMSIKGVYSLNVS